MNRHPVSGFYTDPKPYRRRSGVRPWSRRWSVEFWTEDGDHDFRRFFTRRAAVRWAVEHMGEQWKARVVSAGPTAPMPPRWDMFVVVDPAIDDAPVMFVERDAERGTIRYVKLPDGSESTISTDDLDVVLGSAPVPADAPVRDPLDRLGIERDLLMSGEAFVLKPRCPHPDHDGEGPTVCAAHGHGGPPECELCSKPKGHAGRCDGEPT